MAGFRSSRLTLALVRCLAAAALLAALVPAAGGRPPAALAGGIVVNSAADPGDGACDASCTLRDALLAAAASAGHDTITFSAAVNTPIVLAAALPIITETLTIDGSGQAVTVDGANAYRVFYATAPLTLTALTIQHGRAADGTGGGGAYFGAAAVVSGTHFMSNTTTALGGGLYATAAATVVNSTFISNTAVGHGGGGYIFGTAVITGSTFTRNVVGGTFISSGGGAALASTGSVASSTFMSNTAELNGGGLNGFGAVAVSGSTFTANAANNGGGAHLGSGSTLAASSFYSNTALNDGGGLYWLGAVAGAALAAGATPAGGDIAPITGATFTGNRAQNGAGGGAYMSGPSAISDSTFTRNSAATQGGGVAALAGIGITLTQFATNTALSGGGGAFFDTVKLYATDFVSNTATGGAGGGVRAAEPAIVEQSQFMGNEASGPGGGAWFESRVEITKGVFSENIAIGIGGHGGGAGFQDGAVITGSSFINNTAKNGNGGGLFGSGIKLTDFVVTGNKALCDEDELLAGTQAVNGVQCGNGGGVFNSGSAELWRNGLFFTNEAEGDGGGAYLNGGDYSGEAIRIESNTAGGDGGGLMAAGASLKYEDSVWWSNKAGQDGAAVYIQQSTAALVNSTVGDNDAEAPDGADIGMSFHNARLDAKHVTFAPRPTGFRLAVKVGTDLPDEHGEQDDVASLTNVIFHGYGIAIQGDSPTSTVRANGLLLSSVTTPFNIGQFDISAQYFGPAGFANEAAGDYHLTAGSFAIDRGVDAGVTTDFDGESRPQGNAPDLGADEFDGQSAIFNLLFLTVLRR